MKTTDQIAAKAALAITKAYPETKAGMFNDRSSMERIIKAAIEEALAVRDTDKKDYFPFTPKNWPT